MHRTPAASSGRAASRRHLLPVVFLAVRRRASHPCSRMRSVPIAPSLRRSHFGRDFDLRLQVLAKFPKHTLTQRIGIEFARFCKLDNSFGDSFIDEIALVIKLKSYASHFESDAHDPLGLEIESGTVQKLRDRHDLPHRAREDCSGWHNARPTAQFRPRCR